ncbi:hypothetical protein [Streptomyces sp. NPDC056387]|uniref:hypothetical protein n=1 Tax=Streptomyces sp. NPDC056387 TaxID=3345803 RepID=UPI0035DEDA63
MDGVIRHGVLFVGSAQGCACHRYACGGLVPVSWCVEHGDAACPAMDWHPGGGIRCAVLAHSRVAARVVDPV